MTSRAVGLWLHPDRNAVAELAIEFTRALNSRGLDVRTLPEGDPDGLELLIVLGGDGTILSAVEMALPEGLPLLGVNLGRVGFLAEAEPSDVETIADAVAGRTWQPESRVTLEIGHYRQGLLQGESFALNEAAIEKIERSMMVQLRVRVDGDPLMAWSGDGLLVATPTGSTAYAFSAGGPIVWPTADVLEVVPISAHALFARPIVLDPAAVVEIEVLSEKALATFDGRRTAELSQGDVLRVRRGSVPQRFARVHATTFTQRLVAKFRLPTVGWREGGR